MARFLIGPSSLDLGALLEQRALVVFDLGDLGDMSRETVGRFVVAQLQAYARRRGTGKTPIHLFIDEAHQFISPSLGRIMKESRKFGLHATLAQQIYGEGMSPRMKEVISGNTAVKITARNADKSLRAFAANTGTDLDLLKSLKKYEYLIQSGDNPAIKFRLNPATIGTKHSMSDEDWKAVLAAQKHSFYRTVTLRTAPASQEVPVDTPADEDNPIGNFGRRPPVLPT
ncbi:MAG: type IV secretory system conjugative DNA transfer family protein [Pseudomonadota bacterium]